MFKGQLFLNCSGYIQYHLDLHRLKNIVLCLNIILLFNKVHLDEIEENFVNSLRLLSISHFSYWIITYMFLSLFTTAQTQKEKEILLKATE